jgi:hypothetical protein
MHRHACRRECKVHSFFLIIAQNKQRTMKLNILTIYYALGVALLVASIHDVSANKNFEVDDYQIDIDQEVGNVSCYLLVDTTMRRVYHSFQNHMLTSFGFRYDANFKR